MCWVEDRVLEIEVGKVLLWLLVVGYAGYGTWFDILEVEIG